MSQAAAAKQLELERRINELEELCLYLVACIRGGNKPDPVEIPPRPKILDRMGFGVED
jgi:hypothetical protein